MKIWQTFSKIVGLLGLALLVAITPAAAQTNDEFVPYQRQVMEIDGDLYSWASGESELFRETDTGNNQLHVMSPDFGW